MMRASTGLGFAIAALVACAVLGFWLFGDRHEDWFLRAAKDGAVRCLTAGACTRIGAQGEVVRAAPPVAGSVCAKPSDWHAVMSEKKHAVPFLVTCRDGAAYLFHMGKFRAAGQAQWMVCAEATCRTEVRLFAN